MSSQVSIRDIVGPIMVGPSSSHTAGALALASMARRLVYHNPQSVTFTLYGSFAHTYRGHGTDRALVAGMLGLSVDDLRVRDSLKLAEEAGLKVEFIVKPDEACDHPNTVDIHIVRHNGLPMDVRGISVGGGAAVITRINGEAVEITGKYNSVLVEQTDHAGVLARIAKVFSDAGINIATLNMYRHSRGGRAFTLLDTDEMLNDDIRVALEAIPNVHRASILPALDVSGGIGSVEKDYLHTVTLSDEQTERACEEFACYDFSSAHELLHLCDKYGISIGEAFLERDHYLHLCQGTDFEAEGYLRKVLEIMNESAMTPLENPMPSMGGLLGKEAGSLRLMHKQNKGIFNDTLLGRATTYACAVLETNATMGRIVAAPTAGSAGVLPAVLLSLKQEKNFGDKELISALANAAAIGYLVAVNACVSGAQGGCQAEVGTAAAMAASAAAQLYGASPYECLCAASNALTNCLGLVCDPVGGLVEVPCQKRNAAAAANALVSAEIALAGIDNLVDFDETVQAMDRIGKQMPVSLRETALGGIAATPSACAYCESRRAD
ncbi:MAG: L-serine ammonia-lyase, iron-sulfur-dependent, subunit alpha [Eggerthellaceae bacterium]|nr:L-serine ammonia-lyase, iron-sulfur-dependent, subunit alpha [Eggerthellaceae bacterium]